MVRHPYLEEFPFPLFLGGSRYFNSIAPDMIKINEDTDWDYNAGDFLFVDEWLEQNGFTFYNISNHPYHDNSCVKMWKKGTVSVITRKDLKVYADMFSDINPTFYKNLLWKSNLDRKNPINYTCVVDFFNTAYSVTKADSEFRAAIGNLERSK